MQFIYICFITFTRFISHVFIFLFIKERKTTVIIIRKTTKYDNYVKLNQILLPKDFKAQIPTTPTNEREHVILITKDRMDSMSS